MKIMSFRMGSPPPPPSFNFNHKIMVDELEGDGDDDFGVASSDTSSVNSSSMSDDDASSETEHGEEASSQPPASSLAGSTSSAKSASHALQDMSDLMQQLPFKRGLSNFFEGKSQSFSSLANVRSLEDLPKPENPYNKKLKSCKSYAFLSPNHQHPHPHHFPRACSSSRLISKRAPSHSLTAKRNPSFLGLQRAPAAPSPQHRSPSTSGFQNQIPLIA